MVQTGGPGDQNPILLPKIANPTGLLDGSFFTNLDQDELCIFLNGQSQNVTNDNYERLGVKISADQTIPKDVWTDIEFDGPEYEEGQAGVHSTTVDPERFVTPRSGIYLIIFKVEWDSQALKQFEARILKNGTTQIGYDCVTPVSTTGCLLVGGSALVQNEGNDTFTIQARHDDGATKDVLANGTFCQICRLFGK